MRKWLRPPAGGPGFSLSGNDPGAQTYWKREALVYGSGLLGDLPAGFSAPRCYGIDERPDGFVLWLEDVADAVEGKWSLARYGEVARHLGHFNGAYLAGRPLPDAPWLCRDMLRWREPLVARSGTGSPSCARDRACNEGGPATSSTARTGSGPSASAISRHWPVPQVLCHNDADRRNLLVREGSGGAETVAVDWAFLGPQAVGTDALTLAVQRGALGTRPRAG